MQHALFLSPHSNDAAFACGGTMLRLLQFHWKVTLVTLFTPPPPNRSEPTVSSMDRIAPEIASTVGTRSSCQVEDESFARIMGLRDCRWWGFPDASQRGYPCAQHSGGVRQDDTIWRPISERLREIQAELRPDAVFAPQGLNNHVDRLQTILALQAADTLSAQARWYRDMPCAMNQTEALPSSLLPIELKRKCVGLKEMDLERKVLGCCAYASHLELHFGPPCEVGRRLRAFHHSESQHLEEGQLERYAECFLTSNELPPLF